MFKRRSKNISLSSLFACSYCLDRDSLLRNRLPLLILTVCLSFISPQLSYAFSFGKLEMKSRFGEKFRASIILKTSDADKISVAVGSHIDYARLQISRHEAVDSLQISSIQDLGNGQKRVVVTSNKPLFYPSFYLAIKAAQNGGTIIEKFLIAADFRKDLSIGGKKVQNPPQSNERPLKKPVRVQQPRQKTLEVKKKKRFIEIPPAPLIALADPSLPETIVRDLKPRSITEIDTTPEVLLIEEEPLLEAKVVPSLVDPIQQSENEDIPINKITEEIPAQTASFEPTQKVPSKPKQETSSLPSAYGPLSNGETLFSISKELDLPFKTTAQTAAAIWLENPDQFILGNIHGIKKGAILNLGAVESSSMKISVQSARLILNNHWEEWKMIRDWPEPPKNSSHLNPTLVAWPPVIERSAKEGIFALMKDWREAREKNDDNRLLSLYSSDFKGHYWQGRNMRLDEWKNQPIFNPIRINQQKAKFFNAQLTQIADHYFVSIDEWVGNSTSQKLEHRVIEWRQEGPNWKVVGEIFFEPDEEAPEWETSFVVHVSSHPYAPSAWRAVNLWRKRGFNAYISRVDSLKDKTIFRVFVERFSNWKTATEFAKNLRSLDKGSNAIPSRKPFSMSVGIFPSIEGAREKIKSLQKNGISGYVLPYSEDSDFKPSYHVLVGGFANPSEAKPMANLLKELKVGFRLVKL
jgi:cell division septation protein DedD